MKEVSEEKFNRLLEKHIDLKPCKRCGYPTGEIVVRLPIYGKCGIERAIQAWNRRADDEQRAD